jgi:hypothetical protein
MPSVTTLLVFVLSLAALPAAAQGGATAPRDPELMNYRLSMDKLRRLPEAQRALNAAHAKNPQLFDIMDRERQAMANATVAQRAAMLDRRPDVKNAFTSVGWTARDWLLTTEAMGKAFTAIAAREGTVTAPPPRTDAEKANVALLEKNDAEFKKILEELDQLTDELINQSE